MKRKWNILLYILAVVLIVCGLLALWLPNRNAEENADATRPDTDPNAPFVDLPEWEKEKVLQAIEEYWEMSPRPGKPKAVFWYGEKMSGQESPLAWENYKYGVQYYGTFGGYYIILSPFVSQGMGPGWEVIGDYYFEYGDAFDLVAYKNGVVAHLKEIYEKGELTDEQMGQIYQCYERYSNEIYPYWEYFPNRE